MNQTTIKAKLDSLARCLMRIESKKPFDAKRLASDLDLQDVVVQNLERAVQQCVDIASSILATSVIPAPGNMADAFTGLHAAGWIDAPLTERMKKAVGFRNLAIHEYEKLDWIIVHAITHKHLDDFRAFAQAVTAKAGI